MSSSVLWYPTRWVYCEVMDAIQGEGYTQLCAYHSSVAIEQLGGHFHISIQSINELWNPGPDIDHAHPPRASAGWQAHQHQGHLFSVCPSVLSEFEM